jgi:hypothetical protein
MTIAPPITTVPCGPPVADQRAAHDGPQQRIEPVEGVVCNLSEDDPSDGVNDHVDTSEGFDRHSKQWLHIEFVGHVAALRGAAPSAARTASTPEPRHRDRRSGGLGRVSS